MQKLGSAAQLAARYSVSPCTIWRWAADDVLEPIRLSPGCTRFDIEDSDRRIAGRNLTAKDVSAAVEQSVQSEKRHKRGRAKKAA